MARGCNRKDASVISSGLRARYPDSENFDELVSRFFPQDAAPRKKNETSRAPSLITRGMSLVSEQPRTKKSRRLAAVQKKKKPEGLESLRSKISVRMAGVALSALLILLPAMVFANEAGILKTTFSGYFKTLNFFTRTGGFSPEFVDLPVLGEARENVFSNLERLRLKIRSQLKIDDTQKLTAEVDYDHQAFFGSFVATGDFRVARTQIERRQFLDLSQTLVEDEDGFYEHRFYRLSLRWENEWFELEIGRQQIPWGVGRFFTPTDLFNPFNPTQIELNERDGVDAVNLITKQFDSTKIQFVYTPGGRELHPQRYLGRISRDIKGFEVGLLGGRIKRDQAFGLDLAGNLDSSAVRAEFLFREAAGEKDFFKFTVNADYNFPHNIYALLEYHYNGQGRDHPDAYQWDRLVRGDIQQMGKNYLALQLGYDITELLRLEYRSIMNLDDVSLFLRPELQYEWQENLLLTLGTQLYFGSNDEEFGQPRNLFLGEMKYSF